MLLSAPFDPDARGSCLLDRKALPLEFKIEDEADTMDGTTQMETESAILTIFSSGNGVKLMLASFNLYTSLNIVKEAFAVKPAFLSSDATESSDRAWMRTRAKYRPDSGQFEPLCVFRKIFIGFE